MGELNSMFLKRQPHLLANVCNGGTNSYYPYLNSFGKLEQSNVNERLTKLEKQANMLTDNPANIGNLRSLGNLYDTYYIIWYKSKNNFNAFLNLYLNCEDDKNNEKEAGIGRH